VKGFRAQRRSGEDQEETVESMKEKLNFLVATIEEYKSVMETEILAARRDIEKNKRVYLEQIRNVTQEREEARNENRRLKEEIQIITEAYDQQTKSMSKIKKSFALEHTKKLQGLALELTSIEENNEKMSYDLKEEKLRHLNTKEQLKLTKKIIEQMEISRSSKTENAPQTHYPDPQQLKDSFSIMQQQLQLQIDSIQNVAKEISQVLPDKRIAQARESERTAKTATHRNLSRTWTTVKTRTQRALTMTFDPNSPMMSKLNKILPSKEQESDLPA